ncbi:DUF4276 family protein [Aquimarina sp. AD10]|uniref:DUF4276 family protein n=1 Tax=Aquimarina sp. AD10 TaxID=1714849 RepID=UPI000E5170B4|nr:DUF4276 family protein [Aquimarina sp. AD10]AXT59534.1 DUF4276 family protein [Aquimarina sp. AD10]RKM93434.1 DUF4276 family protein [Aquimarina sp. AD10]
MRRLYFVVEGYTEREFVNKTLLQYFVSKGIYDVRAVEITTSKGHKGGLVNYQHLKNDINNFLKSENQIIVTTFVDFFRLPNSMPNYNQLDTRVGVDDKIELLELGMSEDINDHRFLPYVQKHEFEALLFSSKSGFELMYDNHRIVNELSDIVDEFDNPEDINTRPEFAPSKRLINILSNRGERYDKVAEGNLIAEEIGIDVILAKCPRFKKWIEKLEELIKS